VEGMESAARVVEGRIGGLVDLGGGRRTALYTRPYVPVVGSVNVAVQDGMRGHTGRDEA
jgi:hypothetical protein